jgi:hypothetical protein
MKTTLLAAALMAVLISSAGAQDNDRLAEASLDHEGHVQVPARAEVLGNPSRRSQTPPTWCRPCLFYAGDFDTNASDANGLSNEFDLTVSTGAAVYTPFIVPKGKTWTVTGLFTDNIMLSEVLDPRTIPFEIRKGIPKAGGNGGELVCDGKKPGSLTPLPQNWFGYPWAAAKVEHIKGCRLPAGKYWMSVVPYCTNKNDSYCNDYRAFLANDDGAMAQRFGPLEPANNSFFNSKFYGANWDPSSKWQTSSRFSVGVEGTAK